MSSLVDKNTDRFESVSIYTSAVTGLKVIESEAMFASEILLDAWDEPYNPLFDPANYNLGLSGKLPERVLSSVPFTLALGGLTTRRSDLIDPITIAQVTENVEANINTFRVMSRGLEAREATIHSARNGLVIYETFGALGFLGKNTDARKAIKKSGSFTRRELREII